jgi:GR25 family glycosyltransferase involved in LPS biosynthesis
MWATKAYILKIDSDISNEYAKICADSCDDVGLRWEYFNGYQNQSGKSVFASLGIHCVHPEPYAFIANPTPAQKAACTTAGHFAIWKAISEGPDEAVVILEHDAIMLHPVTVDVPDDRIVVLGYKVLDPTGYDHKTAGMPKELIEIQGHEGAHAYAITRVMAKKLLKELQEQGIRSAIDNDYFIVNQRRTKYQLCIASPTPALGWLRESTIWGKSAARNYKFIPSFQENYK